MEEGGMEVGAMPPEEEGASLLPFVLLAALLAAGWWFWSNSGAQQSSAGAAAAVAKPDPEELRRKRLEALQASMSSQQPAETRAQTAAEAPAAKAPKPPQAAPEKPVAEKPAVEKPVADKPAAAKPAEAKNAEEEGLRKRAVPAVKSTAPGVAPAKEAPAAAKENTPPPATPQRFAIRARNTQQGASVLRQVEGVEASTTVKQLRDMLQKAFLPEAKGHNLRIFFSGKELKNPDESVRELGLNETTCLQVMLTPAPGEAQATAASQADAVAPPGAEPLTVRLQSTVGGRTCAHVIEELTAASRVLELEGLALGAFAPGEGQRPRLFFMGRELKEADAFLGHVGLKTKSTATVQVMFAAGEPRAEAKVPRAPGPPAETTTTTEEASGSSAAAGTPSPEPPRSTMNPAALAAAAGARQAETGDAVLAAAEAAGCNVSALMGGAGAQPEGAEEASPGEAWRAMAALEEQLARETDFSEDISVRQASTMLRHMLTTAAHDSNPALMQMAQTMVPDLKKIWGFEPTRDHLKGLLTMKAGSSASS